METSILLTLIEDGKQAYRRGYHYADCPTSNNLTHELAWKAGFRIARDGISMTYALNKFLQIAA